MDIKGFKSKDGTVHQYDYDALANKPEAPGSGGNVDLTGVVKSVNGQTPDENGNVEIDASRPTDEQVNTAVNAFLEENPVSSGIGSKASALLITILRNGVYNTNQSANITALENALKSSSGGTSGGSGGGGNETPDEPDVPGVTLSSISATYSGGDVPAGTSVLALSGIVVTAHYSDGSTATVTDYELSGEIVEGSNTVTVTYGGMTATFTVTGVVETSGSYAWTKGYFASNGNISASDTSMCCEDYFAIAPGKYGCIYSTDQTWPFTEGFACYYDSEKNFIERSYKSSTPADAPEYDGIIVTFSAAPENAAFFRVSATGVGGYENSITISAEPPKPYVALEDATWEAGYINGNGNLQTYPDNTRWASSKISVEPGATYRFGNSNPECNMTTFYTHLYENIVPAGNHEGVGTAEFTVPEGYNYVRLSARVLSEDLCKTATLEKIS